MAKDDEKFNIDGLKPDGTDDDKGVIRATYAYREQSHLARYERMQQNRTNWDIFNMKGDFSHKKAGQSKEFLPKMSMAVEQLASFMSQAMLDNGDWFGVDPAPGISEDELKIKPGEIQKLTNRQLDKCKFDEVIHDSFKMSAVGSLMIAKVHGQYVDKPHFFTEKRVVDGSKDFAVTLKKTTKKVWCAKIDLIRQEDWYPDPTGDNLYAINQIHMDLHKVQELAQGPNAIYDEAVVSRLVGGFDDLEQEAKKARETNQNMTQQQSYRKRVRLWEGWGTILDANTGRVLYENVTWTVANDRYLIQKPTPIPFWHGKWPFVSASLLRVPGSVWHRALMDAPAKLNIAENEIFNLMLDTGIMAAFGIRQIRPSALVDENKYSNGVPAGETIEVNETLPPGQRVLEPCQTATMSPEATQMLNTVNAEFSAAALTNDLRMGVLPQRQVKATEVVEASQTITSMFTGVAKVIERHFVLEILELLWMTMAQNMNDLDEDEVQSLLGADRAKQLMGLSPEERFAATVKGYKFSVFGISDTMARMKDFRKITSLLQTISASEPMVEEFIRRYDFGKLLTEIMRALDIRPEKIELTDKEKAQKNAQQQQQQNQTLQSLGGQPNAQSQIPQAGGMKPDGNPGGPQPAATQGPPPGVHMGPK